MDKFIENDIPKHKKKKKSSTSDSREKSRHKHEYTEKCILKCPIVAGDKVRLHIATYCGICGKIGSITHPETEDEINHPLVYTYVSRFMTDEEILENYKDLEIIEVSDIFQKYVPISKGGE